MASSVRGFLYRDLTQHAKAEIGHVNANVAKVVPSNTLQTIFTVTGVIAVTALYGVITTALASSAKPTIGVDTLPAAIATAPASGFTGTAGQVIIMPTAVGGQLPALATTTTVASGGLFVVSNTTINWTTDVAEASGNVTWILSWVPLYPKQAATVANS